MLLVGLDEVRERIVALSDGIKEMATPFLPARLCIVELSDGSKRLFVQPRIRQLMRTLLLVVSHHLQDASHDPHHFL